MRRVLALLTALLAGAAVLAVVPAPTAIGEDPITLGVSPTAARTNATITVSGQGCYLDDGITAADGLLLRLVDPGGRSAAAATIAVELDGTWNGPFTIPGDLPAGEYRVQGTCIAPEFTGATVQGGTFTVTGPGPAPAGSAAETEAITNPQQIEPYAQYDGQSSCSPSGKPGMVAFRDMVMATYPSTGSYGISRDCGIGGQSEHKEGRAWDWAVDANSAQDRAIVQEVMDWLFATDRYGHRHAMARRLGMMYIIWNRQIFKLYQADRGWQPYSGSSPHTDHVHFSLSRAGGRKQTSFWSLNMPGPGPLSGPGGFTDVPRNAWYGDALEWAVDGRVITGFPDGTFRPKQVVNRAQAVAWTWIQAGRPAASRSTSFDDVRANAWYKAALDWAVEQGLTSAHTGNEFRPKRQVARAEFAFMLWAYADSPRPWTSNPFSDVVAGKTRSDAAIWAHSLGYVTGFPDGTFKPGQGLNRAQSAAWLHAARQFVDVPARSWFTPGVDWGRFRSVLRGNGSHAYRPAAKITRRELAVALWWAFDRPTAPLRTFSDLTNDMEARKAASWALEAGILHQIPQNGSVAGEEFGPANRVYRGHLVLALWKVTGQRPATANHPWSDAKPWYEEALDWAFQHSIVSGYADGTFRGHASPAVAGGQFAARSQVAVFLRRLAATPGAWAGSSSPPATVLF